MNIYEHIDYTLLKATATYNDIWNLCEEAEEKGCASVCIPPHFVGFVADHFPTLNICTVVGFPLGNSTIETKVAEAKRAIRDGADEIDMVINIGELKNGNYPYIKNEIDTIRKVTYGHILKVIVETCYLTNKEIENVTFIVDESDADYIKTSTGYGTRGASFEDIEIMKSVIIGGTKIKASGGIRTKEEMEKYLELGCDRIGASKLP
jgi:deoxyribose-phosphate aldolase